MPITQERMLELIRIGRALQEENKKLRKLFELYCKTYQVGGLEEPTQSTFTALAMEAGAVPVTNTERLGVEVYHFRVNAKRNERYASKMRAIRQSRQITGEQPEARPAVTRVQSDRPKSSAIMPKDLESVVLQQTEVPEFNLDEPSESDAPTNDQVVQDLRDAGFSEQEIEKQLAAMERAVIG